MKNIETGSTVKIMLEPLSHGGQATYLRVTAQVIDSQSTEVISESDEEVKVSVAVLKFVEMREEYGDGSLSCLDEWSTVKVDCIETIVSVDNGPWMHMCFPVAVNFVEEENTKK
jgi:hypothetical protein